MSAWLQSSEGFDNAKNNIKQRNLNTVFADISKTASPTSDSFLLIMSHIWDCALASTLPISGTHIASATVCENNSNN